MIDLIAALLCSLAFAETPPVPPEPATPPAAATVVAAVVAVPADASAATRLVTDYAPVRAVTLLGPVASRVYATTNPGFSAGVSSEFFTYARTDEQTVDEPVNARANVANVRPTFGYRLHPRLVFNAQLSFDDGGAERSDTVTLRRGGATVRFAYLDWFSGADQRAGVRIGHQLVPVGLTNTSADPTTFFGVRRPELERVLVPGDWHENGVLAWFDHRGVILEAGVFNSLNARGLRGDTFLAGGRSGGQNAPATDLAAIARANVGDGGWLVGGSVAVGRSAQGNPAIPGGVVQLGEVHARLRRARLEALVQVAQGRLTDAGIISALNESVVGAKATGVAAHLAYELLGEERRALWAFVRHSVYDLHAQVPAGFLADPRLSRRVTTVGASYLPLPNVVVKADVQRDRDGGGADRTLVSLGGGLLF